MNQIPHWTKRATKRLRDAVQYIAANFYPEYAIAFSNDILDSAALIPQNPHIGTEAFPAQDIPQCRKLLCKNRHWWIFYRIKADCIEIISIKHILQDVRSLRSL